MPNIATALKGEISRIARKEVKRETAPLKKQLARHRFEIAALKRSCAELVQKLRGAARGAPRAVELQDKSQASLRFRAAGFAKHRARLGLSAADTGLMLGVSGQTVYHWEAAKAKPRASQMAAIAAFRKLSKTQASAIIERLRLEASN